MKIEEIINRWFDDVEGRLKNLGLPKNGVNQMILASISVVDNYLNNILMILNQDSKLPAMALLRVIGEFIVKLVWCIQGSTNNQPKQSVDKFKSWKKHSLKELNKFRRQIIDRYNNATRKMLQKQIDKDDKEIESITVDYFAKEDEKQKRSISSFFNEVFGVNKDIYHPGMYLQYLRAVHIDYITLNETIKEQASTPSYEGDVDCDIENLKIACLLFAHLFFKEVCRYYNMAGVREIEYYNYLRAIYG